jgi:hypothetical protein
MLDKEMNMTTFDFGNGPVPAHQHSNGGGCVADTAKVADTAYVGPDAQVYDVEGEIHNLTLYTGDCNARVYDNAEEDIFIEMDGKRYKLVEIV